MHHPGTCHNNYQHELENGHDIPLFDLWLVNTQAQQSNRAKYEQDHKIEIFDYHWVGAPFSVRPVSLSSL